MNGEEIVITTQEIYHQNQIIKSITNMLKIQMLEQIVNNDENSKEVVVARKVDGAIARNENQYGHAWEENGSIFKG